MSSFRANDLSLKLSDAGIENVFDAATSNLQIVLPCGDETMLQACAKRIAYILLAMIQSVNAVASPEPSATQLTSPFGISKSKKHLQKIKQQSQAIPAIPAVSSAATVQQPSQIQSQSVVDRVESLSPLAVRRLKETVDAAAVSNSNPVDSKPTHAVVTMPVRPAGPPPSPKIGKQLPHLGNAAPPTRSVTIANNLVHNTAAAASDPDDSKARAALQRSTTAAEIDAVSPRKPKPLPSLPKLSSSSPASPASPAAPAAAAATAAAKNYSSLALIDSFLDDYVDKNLVHKVMHYGSLPAELLDEEEAEEVSESASERAVVYESLPVPPQRESPDILVEWNESERPAMEADMELCGESGVFEPKLDHETSAILDQLLEDEEKEKEKEKSSRKSQ